MAQTILPPTEDRPTGAVTSFLEPDNTETTVAITAPSDAAVPDAPVAPVSAEGGEAFPDSSPDASLPVADAAGPSSAPVTDAGSTVAPAVSPAVSPAEVGGAGAITGPALADSGDDAWEGVYDDEEEGEGEASKRLRDVSTPEVSQACAMALDPEAAFQDEDFTDVKDPSREKMLRVNDAFMRSLAGAGVPYGEEDIGRKMARQEISLLYFGGRGGESEEAFNGEVVKFALGRKDRGELDDDLARRARRTVVLGVVDPSRSIAAEWTVFRDEARRHPGYKPEDEPEIFKRWNDTLVKTRQSLGGLPPHLTRVWNILEPAGASAGNGPLAGPPAPVVPFTGPPEPGKVVEDLKYPAAQGMAGTPPADGTSVDPSGEAAAATFEIFRQLPEGERARFMDGVGVMADALPPDKRRTFLMRLTTGGNLKDRFLLAYEGKPAATGTSVPYSIIQPVHRSAAEWSVLHRSYSQKSAFGDTMRAEQEFARKHSSAESFAEAFTIDGKKRRFEPGSPEYQARVSFWKAATGRLTSGTSVFSGPSGYSATYRPVVPSDVGGGKQLQAQAVFWKPLIEDPRLTPEQRAEFSHAGELARESIKAQIAYRDANPYERRFLELRMHQAAASEEIFIRDQSHGWKSLEEREAYLADFEKNFTIPLLAAAKEEAAAAGKYQVQEAGGDVARKYITFSALHSNRTAVSYKAADVVYGLAGDLGNAVSRAFTGKSDPGELLGEILNTRTVAQARPAIEKKIRELEKLAKTQESIPRMTYGGMGNFSNLETQDELGKYRAALNNLNAFVSELKEKGIPESVTENIVTDLARTTNWTDDVENDYLRVLTTGEVTLNPDHVYGDVAAMRRAIDSLDITDGAKQRAHANLNWSRKARALNTLAMLEGKDWSIFREDFEKVRQRLAEKNITDPAELVDAYRLQMGERHWAEKAADSVNSGLLEAGRGLYRQALAVDNLINTAEASVYDAVGLDSMAGETRKRIRDNAEAQQIVLEASEVHSQTDDLAGSYGLLRDIVSTAGQMAPTVAVGLATGGSSLSVQLIASGTIGGIQGFGSTMDAAITAERQKLGRPLSREELEKLVTSKDVLLTAGLNAALTAGTSLVFRGGAEGAAAGTARQITLRELARKLTTEEGRAIFKETFKKDMMALLRTSVEGFKDEAMEETLNQMAETMVHHFGLGVENDAKQTLLDWIKSGLLGGAMGSAAPHFHNPTKQLAEGISRVNQEMSRTSDPATLASLQAQKQALEKQWADRAGGASAFPAGVTAGMGNGTGAATAAAMDTTGRDFAAAVRRIQRGEVSPDPASGVAGSVTGAPAATPAKSPAAGASPQETTSTGPGKELVSLTLEHETMNKLHDDLTRGGVPPSIASEALQKWTPIVNLPGQTMDHLRSSGLGGRLPNLEKALGGLPGKITGDILQESTTPARPAGVPGPTDSTVPASRTSVEPSTDPTSSVDATGPVNPTALTDTTNPVDSGTSVDTTTTVETDTPSTQTSPPTSRAVREITDALSKDIPHINWDGQGGALDSHWGRSPGAIARLLPLAILSRNGGKSRRRNRAFTAASDTDLAALGARPEAITRLRQSQEQGTNATYRAVANLIDTLDPNSPSARSAVNDLESRSAASRQAFADLKDSGGLPSVVPQDGGYVVYDPASGQEIGRSPTPDGAAVIVNELVGLQSQTTGPNGDGAPTPPTPPRPPVAPPVAPLPPLAVPRPRDPSQKRPSTFREAVELLGLHVKAIWTHQDIADLRESLRVENPEKEVDHIESVEIVPGIEDFTETDIRQCVQDLLDILPKHIAETLPKIKISLVDTPIGRSGNANGLYRPWELTLRVTTANLTYLKGERLRRKIRSVFAHEVMHWAHISSKGPQADAYRHMITAHFNSRTEGKELVDGEYKDGGWYDLYAGRCYSAETEAAYGGRGLELPPMYYELWVRPHILSKFTNLEEGDSAIANRETFYIINQLFDNP